MSAKAPAPATDERFEALLDFLRRSRGFDFTGYKRSSLMRRVRKRMQVVGIGDFVDYMDYLEVHPDEFGDLFNTILINVTAFWRDAESWAYLAQEIVPRIVRAKGQNELLRVWSVGCASGEEAYTLAIILAEALGDKAFRDRVKIYATDVDEEALGQARHAGYSADDLQGIPEARRDQYFEQGSGRFAFRNDLRRSVIFGRHDLIQDAPIGRLDLLVCRNTLMYFNAETQARILARFHFALNDDGYLFLGKAEMLLTHGALFAPVELRHRVFQKAPRPGRTERAITAEMGGAEGHDHAARFVRLREAAFDSTPIMHLVVDAPGALMLANEAARAVFGLTARDLGRPFFELPASYRPVDLRSAVDRAHTECCTLSLPGVEYVVGGELRFFDIQVVPLENEGRTLGASVTFLDVTRVHAMQGDVQRFKHELETAYEELQSANEELETTNE